MSTIPRDFTIADIIPPEVTPVGRDGYQECKLHKTAGRRSKWYCKYAVDALVGPGEVRRVERREYFGVCGEIGKREAERARDAFKKIVNSARDQGVRESQIPLTNWIRTYDETFIAALKPNTQPNYRACCGLIEAEFGSTRLADIKTQDIQAWINRLASTRTRGTLERIKAVFQSLFEVAAEYKAVETRNPVTPVKIRFGKRSDVDLRALTQDEVRRVMVIADDTVVKGVSLGPLIRVAIFCGPRIGEILALEWGDVQPPVIHISKSRAQRGYVTTEPKTAAGKRVLPLGPVVLLKPDGAQRTDRVFALEYWHVQMALREIFNKAGITLNGTSCHVLRRTYATIRRAAGAVSLRESMGHETDAMSARYVYETLDDQAAITNRMAAMVMGEVGWRKQ